MVPPETSEGWSQRVTGQFFARPGAAKVPIFTEDMGGALDLLCPRCGADLLHHLSVTVCDRGEDAAHVLRTTVQQGSVAVDTTTSVQARNPSARRGGLFIRFWCEGCGGHGDDELIELTIAQHKGSTEIGWRFTPYDPNAPRRPLPEHY